MNFTKVSCRREDAKGGLCEEGSGVPEESINFHLKPKHWKIFVFRRNEGAGSFSVGFKFKYKFYYL